MLDLVDLDGETRQAMLSELDADLSNGSLYLSPRLSALGREHYPEMLREAFASGTDETLANALASPGVLNEYEISHSRHGVPHQKRVRVDAPIMLAEGEFNRFYLRALAINVQAFGGDRLEIYRAKPVRSARSASLALEGQMIDAAALLADLRANKQTDTALGLPPGPNSGMSARYLKSD